MGRVREFGGACTAGLLVLAMTACGGDDDNPSPTTTTVAEGRTIGNCKIQPNTSCVGANLAGANLPGANLTGATLTGANLTGVNLAGATLSNANLSGANLTSAVLINATMIGVNVSGANLTQANFTGATIQNLNDAGATQCETIRNDGTVNNASCPPPSTVTTTNTSVAPLNLPCAGQPNLFLAVYQSQADNFNVPGNLSTATTTVGAPSCASDGWATQNLRNSSGQFLAVFQAASKGWQLMSITGCQGTNVPQQDRAGICQ